MIKTIWEDIDKEEISKSVILLDMFTKTYCRYLNDYERFGDLMFRCNECPFSNKGNCLIKEFKCKYAPDYRDFGAMGDINKEQEECNKHLDDECSLSGEEKEDISNPDEALEKIKAYEQEQNKIKVGDEVYTSKDKNGKYLDKGVVLWIDYMTEDSGGWNIGVMSRSGHMYGSLEICKWHKTGKHYDIQSILDGLKEESICLTD